MAPQESMDSPSDDSTQVSKLYLLVRRRQTVLHRSHENIRRIVLHRGIESGLRSHLLEVRSERVVRKRVAEEEERDSSKKTKIEKEEKTIQTSTKNAGKSIIESVNAQDSYVDPFNMDQFYASLGVKQR